MTKKALLLSEFKNKGEIPSSTKNNKNQSTRTQTQQADSKPVEKVYNVESNEFFKKMKAELNACNKSKKR